MSTGDREVLESLFCAAVDAALPEKVIGGFLPAMPKGRTVVVGAGKGAAQLARALEAAWPGPLGGTVVTRYGFAVECERIRVMEASHPIPDAAGLDATRVLFETVAGLGSDDLVIALVCGGGSALLPAPPAGFGLDDERQLNEILLRSGAPISAMNAIRKHFSQIKGGRLAAAAAPARVVSLVVSDIPGDDPAQVASGPTVADRVSAADALRIIQQYRLDIPRRIRDWIASSASWAPLPDDPAFSRNEVHVIASAARSLEAAAEAAKAAGIESHILSDAIEGEAREAGSFHAALAREVALRNRPFAKPAVLLSGGETTVTVSGNGKGGRNTEFLLSFALGIADVAGITAMAADTDGIDGSEDNAGAFCDGLTIERMGKAGCDPKSMLNANDAWSAFHASGDLFVPGPTGTNVNDFRAILIR